MNELDRIEQDRAAALVRMFPRAINPFDPAQRSGAMCDAIMSGWLDRRASSLPSHGEGM